MHLYHLLLMKRVIELMSATGVVSTKFIQTATLARLPLHLLRKHGASCRLNETAGTADAATKYKTSRNNLALIQACLFFTRRAILPDIYNDVAESGQCEQQRKVPRRAHTPVTNSFCRPNPHGAKSTRNLCGCDVLKMKSSATPVHKIVRLHPANPPNPRS
jgi:hypothetical protein